MRIRTIFAAAVLVTLPVLALAQDDHASGHDIGGAALMEANRTMMEAMDGMQPTGDTDRDFVTMMIAHHQGAIDMAKVELAHGDDPEIRAMAEAIIAAQEAEIVEMREWLTSRSQ